MTEPITRRVTFDRPPPDLGRGHARNNRFAAEPGAPRFLTETPPTRPAPRRRVVVEGYDPTAPTVAAAVKPEPSADPPPSSNGRYPACPRCRGHHATGFDCFGIRWS